MRREFLVRDVINKFSTWFGWISVDGRRVSLHESPESSEDVEAEDDVIHVASTHLHVAILLKNGKIELRKIDDFEKKLETLEFSKKKVDLIATSSEVFVILTDQKESEVVKILDDVEGIQKTRNKIEFPWPVRIDQVASGHDFLIFKDTNGNLFSMGTGTRGELGVGLIRHVAEPVHIEQLAGIRIRKVVCGGWHTVALTEGGDVYTWGWNRNGQLGKQKMSTEVYPILVDALEEFSCPEENVEDIDATEHTSILLIREGGKEETTKFVLGSDSVPINNFLALID